MTAILATKYSAFYGRLIEGLSGPCELFKADRNERLAKINEEEERSQNCEDQTSIHVTTVFIAESSSGICKEPFVRIQVKDLQQCPASGQQFRWPHLPRLRLFNFLFYKFK